ncbi:hypothetical protein [Novosphingopyxis sp. YJ-S2-01]|uniref:hypothetical protein n=1 Tax=Novosphingopyxis sp. YJ-S2-01 TaxID=2794021 RepID=UPI0018DB006F|nr:hypothetical protein [Novosphingopyxis sp. YJ-S2-01]
MQDIIYSPDFVPMMVAIVLITTAAWIGTTWIKVKNGYPLTGSWGQSIYPKNNEETVERVKLISQENAQLRAELSSVKERLATVERIVTDGSNRLSDEIESLRGRAN